MKRIDNYQEITWRSAQTWPTDQLAPAIKRLLLERSSLTQYTRQQQGIEWRVELLQQGWCHPSLSEAQCLGLLPHNPTYRRTVLLRYGADPWMYAWTLIPKQAAAGHFHSLVTLGEKPLGNVLFNLPHVQRSDFELALLTPAHQAFYLATAEITELVTHLWARRSVFTVQEENLLLSEIFLPAMLNQCLE